MNNKTHNWYSILNYSHNFIMHFKLCVFLDYGLLTISRQTLTCLHNFILSLYFRIEFIICTTIVSQELQLKTRKFQTWIHIHLMCSKRKWTSFSYLYFQFSFTPFQVLTSFHFLPFHLNSHSSSFILTFTLNKAIEVEKRL